VPVYRYRSIEEMPRPWRSADDPENLRIVAFMFALHRALRPSDRRRPGVTRYRSIEEAEADRDDRSSS
jgi:hypothetical protein